MSATSPRVPNSQISDLFDEMAGLLELQQANPFRIRAYRNAARVVRNWPHPLSELLSQQGRLPRLPGLGADLSAKALEVIRTHRLAALEALRLETPPGLLELLQLPHLGPKRIGRLHSAFGVSSAEDLRAVVESGRLRELQGFGPVIENALRTALNSRSAAGAHRWLRARVESVAEAFLTELMACDGTRRGAIAGSYRRRRGTVGDLDFLVSSTSPGILMDRFTSLEGVERVFARGSTRSTVILRSGIQVDLRVVEDRCFGAALHYFTGSKEHNIAIRRLAIERGLKISEYGVFRGEHQVGGREESEVFSAVGLHWIPPELRENQGEIEAAANNALPRLVRLEELRGDLHVHTKSTDGRLSLTEMAQAAISLGREYVGITEHSKSLRIARGMDARRLRDQIRSIDRMNESFEKEGIRFRLIKGCEVDILEDGSLDLPDSILSELDLTVCSIHSQFRLSAQKQMDRLLRAMDHPAFKIWGHPTSRLIGSRPPIEIDLERALHEACERGVWVEVNSQPERLDLDDRSCRLAREIGVGLVISTDAHDANELDFLRNGVDQARRGWIESQQVLNTRSLAEVLTLLKTRCGPQLKASPRASKVA